jgi:hypothetical protein
MTVTEKLLSKEKAETTAAKATLIAEKLTAAGGKKCTRQMVEHWVRNGRVPGWWAPVVNRVYRIPLHDLLTFPQSAA